MLQEFQSKEHEILSAVVLRTDSKRGTATLEVGKNEAILPKSEQVPGEELREGDRIKVYVVEVAETEKGPRMMISRTHPGLVKRLFEMEVRDFRWNSRSKGHFPGAGSERKLPSPARPQCGRGGCSSAPEGAGGRIVEELGGEKIDVVKYSEDPASSSVRHCPRPRCWMSRCARMAQVL
ncbi:MAG: S1 RNA-binding domain-containing protein [Oscillospiraceae bacterium]